MTALAAHHRREDGKLRDTCSLADFIVVQARPVEVTVFNDDGGHLVSYYLRPIQGAIGFCLLARHLAFGRQIKQADGRPRTIREPRAFRAVIVEGSGTFTIQAHGVVKTPLRSAAPLPLRIQGDSSVLLAA